MTEAPEWLEAVRHIVRAVQASDVAELELARGDFRVRVERLVGAVGPPPAPADDAAAGPDLDPHLFRVPAPLTGVFYRAASPTAKPYVSEGEWVDPDTVIGLVETMKIFNEVTADRSGRVVRVLAEGGQLVQAGTPLLAIEPGERTAADAERGL